MRGEIERKKREERMRMREQKGENELRRVEEEKHLIHSVLIRIPLTI